MPAIFEKVIYYFPGLRVVVVDVDVDDEVDDDVVEVEVVLVVVVVVVTGVSVHGVKFQVDTDWQGIPFSRLNASDGIVSKLSELSQKSRAKVTLSN